jgi:carbon monoxide dehydrogenase subunit G
MTVSGGSVFPVEPQRVWALLNDPGILARCAPGCEELQKAGDTFSGRMKIGIGSIKGTYRCQVRLAPASAPDAYTLTIEGKGPLGSVAGEVEFWLRSPAMNVTELRYEGQVDVGGVIASVGQPLLKSVSDYQARQFFERLNQEVAAHSTAAGGQAEP